MPEIASKARHFCNLLAAAAFLAQHRGACLRDVPEKSTTSVDGLSHGNMLSVPVLSPLMVGSPFTGSGIFLANVGLLRWLLTDCSNWVIKPRRVSSPAFKTLRS